MEEDDNNLPPIDIGFSDWFTVSQNDWFINDRIDTFGFVYIHRITGRPLAIYRTIDIEGNVNGYSIASFTNHGIVESSIPLPNAREIDDLLVEISQSYVIDGIWSKCIVNNNNEGEGDDQENNDDDNLCDIITITNNEKDIGANDEDYDYEDKKYSSYYAYFLQCLNMRPLVVV
jgi:hypothetical protein